MNEKEIKSRLKKLELAQKKPLNLYRFQLNYAFTFYDAAKLLDYLKDLGIDTLYLSPIFKATLKSTHGYDVTNPKEISPELGGRAGFDHLVKEAKKRNLHVILDLVANHMSASTLNPWWMELLENGPYSLYGDYFDINWTPKLQALTDKILVPILDEPYLEVLEKGKLTLECSSSGCFLNFVENKLPLSLESYVTFLELALSGQDQSPVKAIAEFKTHLDQLNTGKSLEEKRKRANSVKVLKELWEKLFSDQSLALIVKNAAKTITLDHQKDGALDHLIKKQHYLLEFWQYAPRSINYRRFFDITGLAALRMENSFVFEEFHQSTIDLLLEDKIQGLRIDHPDGFYQPYRYFKNLHCLYLSKLLDIELEAVRRVIEDEKPLYIVIEKILEKGENLPSKWQVEGTVGYEYLNDLLHLFVNGKSEDFFSKTYEEFIEEKVDEKALLLDEKRAFAHLYLTSEMDLLALWLFNALKDRGYEFDLDSLKSAIIELYANFPVYRTYIEDTMNLMSSEDKSSYYEAFDRAFVNRSDLKEPLEVLHQIFFSNSRGPIEQDFVMRFQQLGPSIMAKGFEDTHLYNYNRFIALNEVGGFPQEFSPSSVEFHERMKEKLNNHPYGWITTSTHDTKRSEGFRLKMVALSYHQDVWKQFVFKAKKLNAKYKMKDKDKVYPDLNMEYFIYQTLAGFWPNSKVSKEEHDRLLERVIEYIIKAAKESKAHTNWINQNINYENALKHFLTEILDIRAPFYKELNNLVVALHPVGVLNVLSNLVIKSGLPGALDIYRGCEFLDYHLVDPDNRGVVDFERRIQALNDLEGQSLDDFNLKDHQDNVKMYILKKVLNFRKNHPNLVFEGDYIPLDVEGPSKDSIVAYARVCKEKVLVVIAARNYLNLQLDTTFVNLQGLSLNPMKELLRNVEVSVKEKVALSEVFSDFYFSILY